MRPFADIEQTGKEILGKDWTPEQHAQLDKTPGLLMIKVDFDTFNSQIHPWFHLHFGEKLKEGIQGAYKFEGTLKKLAEGVRDSKEDIFSAAEAIKHEIQLSEAAKIFEAKPGIFGFSIEKWLFLSPLFYSDILHSWTRRRVGSIVPTSRATGEPGSCTQ